MKINKVDMLVAKIESKTSSKDNKEYAMVNLISIPEGDSFQIIEKDMTRITQLTPFTKIKVNLNLTSSQYGLKIDIDDILEIGESL